MGRGWPFFEQLCAGLFKDGSMTRPHRLPNGLIIPPWPKLIDTSSDASFGVGSTPRGADDDAEDEYAKIDLNRHPPVRHSASKLLLLGCK